MSSLLVGRSDPLYGPWWKLNRAEEQASEFRSRFEEWRKSGVYEMLSELNADGTEEVVKLRKAHPFPDTLTCVVADILHNVHTALDQMAFILATKVVGCTNDAALESCYFPAARSKTHFDRRLKKGRELGLVNYATEAFYRRFEPYQGGAHKALSYLHELDLTDKHRSVVDLHSADIVRVTGPHGRKWVRFEPGGPDEIELGRRPPGSDLQYHADLVPRVFFARVKGFDAQPLTETGAFRGIARDVVWAASVAFFGGPPD